MCMIKKMSFYSQHWLNIGSQEIHQDHWSFHLYLSQCHVLHNLYSLQNVIHWQNRQTTRRQIPRTFLWHTQRRQNASKLVVRHFDLPNHSKQHMVVCGLFLHQSQKAITLQQKSIFQIGTLSSDSMNAFHSTNIFYCFSHYHVPTNSVVLNFCI